MKLQEEVYFYLFRYIGNGIDLEYIATSSMTLLDNLTAQLSADRKERFIGLFRELQASIVQGRLHLCIDSFC